MNSVNSLPSKSSVASSVYAGEVWWVGGVSMKALAN